jgi:hypothetical protein
VNPDEMGLEMVGYSEEFFRAVESKYADQARNDFDSYVLRTLSFNQWSGGRFNRLVSSGRFTRRVTSGPHGRSITPASRVKVSPDCRRGWG